jgi:hypothetical protein
MWACQKGVSKLYFHLILIGYTLTALMISLGMVFILDLIHFSTSSAIPSAFAAIGAAICFKV